MAKEYIEREAVEEMLERAGFISDGEYVGYCANDVTISAIPAADVKEVVHGEWDEIPNEYFSIATKNGSYSGNVTSCSVCHEVNPNAYKTNFCPNCGADMRGRKE